MSGNLVDGMMDLCKALKGYEPDDIEWALLGALCLFNIDRSPAIFKPSAAERKQIDTLQVNKLGFYFLCYCRMCLIGLRNLFSSKKLYFQ